MEDLTFEKLLEIRYDSKNTELIEFVDQQEKITEQHLLLKSFALYNLGKSDEASEVVIKLTASSDPYVKTEAFYRLSSAFWLNGDLEKARSNIDQAVNTLKRLDPEQNQTKWLEGIILSRKGTIASFLGDLRKAIENHIQSVDILRKLNTKLNVGYSLAGSLNNLGITYRDVGDLDKALVCLNEALQIARDNKNLSSEMVYLDSLSIICWDRNERLKAFRHLEKALALATSMNNITRLSEYNKRIIQMILLDRKRSIDTTRKYYERMKTLVDETNSSYVNHNFKFIEALILKYSARGLQKYQALELFDELVKNPNLGFHLKSECRLHLTDLLLDELDHYSNEEVLQEILDLSSEIYETAQEQQLVPLAIESLVLKAKLEIINSNFKEADSLFDQALLLAEERQYNNFKNIIIEEQNQMHNNFEEWEKMIRKGAPLRERLKRSKIKEYLDQVISDTSFGD